MVRSCSMRKFVPAVPNDSRCKNSLTTEGELWQRNPPLPDARLDSTNLRLTPRTGTTQGAPWWLTKFWPAKCRQLHPKSRGAVGSQENAWLRQAAVLRYWRAFCFVSSGTRCQIVLPNQANSGEMSFILAKIHPFLKELREKMGTHTCFSTLKRSSTAPSSAARGSSSRSNEYQAMREKQKANS